MRKRSLDGVVWAVAVVVWGAAAGGWGPAPAPAPSPNGGAPWLAGARVGRKGIGDHENTPDNGPDPPKDDEGGKELQNANDHIIHHVVHGAGDQRPLQ